MSTSSFTIQPFNTTCASPEDYAALNHHTNRIRLERLPNDPPVPLQETIQNLQNIPAFVELKLWSAWDHKHCVIIGLGNVAFQHTEDNQHMAQFDITVLSEYRRHGLACQLIRLISESAQADKRRLLMTNTSDRIADGEAFMTRLGAKKGLEAHTNQLCIDELNRDLVAAWLARGQINLNEFEIGFWDGAYPEEMLSQVVELMELMNQQPFGDLEVEDFHTTPEQLRQMENNLFARGSQRWTYYIIDRSTGKFAGYTDTTWNPNRPEVLHQDMTGVFPQYRNKGLGRWLKTSMLEKVLKDRPQVKYIRTGNADSNAPMLKINNELGFKPYTADSLWQIDLTTVQDYIQSKSQ
jgi:mycothiol synthase